MEGNDPSDCDLNIDLDHDHGHDLDHNLDHIVIPDFPDCTLLNLLDLGTDDLDLVVDPKQIRAPFQSSCRVSSEIRWMPGLRAVWKLHPNGKTTLYYNYYYPL